MRPPTPRRRGRVAPLVLALSLGSVAWRDAPGATGGPWLTPETPPGFRIEARSLHPATSWGRPEGRALPRAPGARSSRDAGARAQLHAELGADGAAPFRIVATPGGAVGVRRLSARSAPGRVDGGAVVYEGAAPGVDVRVFATEGGVEELAIVHRPGAVVGVAMDLPPGWGLVRAAAPGLVEVRDDRGAARLRLWTKRAWDAGGREIPVQAEVEARTRVRVTLDETRVRTWPVTVDPEWTAATEMTTPRYGHTATRLPDGRVFIAGGDAPELGLTEIYDPRTATFTSSAPLSRPRFSHTATLLPDGKVLLAGGNAASDVQLQAHDPTGAVEVFDPRAAATASAGPMLGERAHHTATLLMDGRILLAGGLDANGNSRADAEIYDTHALAPAGSALALHAPRADHAAALVPDGRVLLAGGYEAGSAAEVLDPALLQTSPVSGAIVRFRPTATLLPSGDVLVAGGSNDAADLFDPTTSALTSVPWERGRRRDRDPAPVGVGPVLAGGSDEGTMATLDAAAVYDPLGAVVVPVAPMTAPREMATATLLPSGLVLVAGGWDRASGQPAASAELYDPGEATVEATGTMLATRERHTATLLASGKVLVVGGDSDLGVSGAEVFDPATGAFRVVGPPLLQRERHTATLLADHTVLIAGGVPAETQGALNETEVFDPNMERFLAGAPLTVARDSHAAVALGDGSVLLAGGTIGPTDLRSPGGAFSPLAPLPWAGFRVTAVLMPSGAVLLAGGRGPTDGDPPSSNAGMFSTGALTSLPSMNQPRSEHTATLLPDGSVLIAGGSQAPGETAQPPVPIASTERFDGQGFTPAAPMNVARAHHTATRLMDGNVLVTGGNGSSIERYDIASGKFEMLQAALPDGSYDHVATMLGDGRVLVTGGLKGNGVSAVAAIYDPTSQTFSFPTAEARVEHTATRLPSGKLLLAGGMLGTSTQGTATASIFDPGTRLFTTTHAPMSTPRVDHTATLVPDGRVLLAGGRSASLQVLGPTTSVEAFQGGAFSSAGTLAVGRSRHTATLLPSGRVLFAGGFSIDQALGSAEVLDPATGKSTPTSPMVHARQMHAAVRLPSGRVLLAGGLDSAKAPVARAEIFDPATNAFEEVASGVSPIPGDAQAHLLPDGDVLIVGDQVMYRYVEASNALGFVGSAPVHTFGAALLPGGRGLVCGEDRCDTGTISGIGQALVLDGVQADGHRLTALADGEIFALGVTPFISPVPARHTFSFRPYPPGVTPPAVTSAPSQLAAGDPATLAGQRFTHLSARNAATLPALPDVVPLVVFVPDASGVPVAAVVRAWSDTSLTFVAPRTPFTGGGFLHVIVDGVPSAGQYARLSPLKQGSACGLGGECATGYCVDGVCCDAPCDVGCLSCLASKTGSGADGTCGPVASGGAPRFGCEPTGDVCSPTGACDGAGDCAYPPEGTSCDMPPGGTCVHGTCTGPCASNLDCAAGLVCTPDGRCVAPVAAGPDAACSCRIVERPRLGLGLAGALAAAVVGAFRRARRARRQKP